MSREEPLEEMARARVGRVLGKRWRLDSLLGCGGVGAVYAATHRTGSRVAVKMLHEVLVDDHELKQRFLREAYVANTIRHPGVVSVLDDDADEEGVPFLVMELLDGMTAEQRASAQGDRMDPREALWIADRLLSVLVTAHAARVVHRDIKPENLFITSDGRLKVLDFGIARLHEGDRRRTAEGVVLGTLSYMPPEQARGEWSKVDHRADVFAVGATLFSLMSGQRLHENGTFAEQFAASMTKPAPPLASVMPRVTPAIATLVDRALAFEPDGRFPDARSMQSAVQQAYLAAAGVALSPAEWAPRSAPRPERPPAAPLAMGDGDFDPELSVELAGAYPGAGPPSHVHTDARSDAPTLARAQPTSRRVLALDELADGLVNRGRGRHEHGELDGAVADYTRAIEVFPRHAAAYHNRGLARLAQGDVEEALLDFGRAADRDAELADPLYSRARLLATRGQLVRARSDAVRALELWRAQGHALGIRAATELCAYLDGATSRRG